MKFSETLIKTRREKVKESESINGDLLIRGNYIDQVSAGVYTFLPLGLLVMNKIENIIRAEMNKVGGQELLMPVLHPKENWEKTGRWESMDDLFKFTSYYSKADLALGPTHEEIIVPLSKRYIESYKDLPKYLFQIQDKFRDEKRAKSGILRGREFMMKDLYSFHADEADLNKYYEQMKIAYRAIFDLVGIGKTTYLTFASGGSFSKYSHEYQTLTEAGEDLIYLCEKCKVAINKEIIGSQAECPECKNKDLKELKAVEVGNIFKLRTKFSEPFELKYTDKSGKEKLVEMGCYGIGLSRLMGTIVEVSHDDRGIIWPKEVSPFQVHLVELDNKHKEAEALYNKLLKSGIEVLWDDREETAGVKFADADLIGVPIRVIISTKSLAEGKIEVKKRSEKESKLVTVAEFLKGLNV